MKEDAPRRSSLSPFVLGVVLAAGAAVSAAAALILSQRQLWQRHVALEADQIQWVLFLKEGADRASVEEPLRILPGLRSLRFVSKEEALETASADPVFAEGLSLTGGNPFPESFIAHWDAAFTRGDLLEHHARRLASLPGVDHVDYDRPRVDRFALAQKALAQMDLAVETLAAVAAALLLVLAGRLLFFAPSAPSPLSVAAGIAAALAGAAGGAFSARFLGLSPDFSSFLAGAAAAGILALGREALSPA